MESENVLAFLDHLRPHLGTIALNVPLFGSLIGFTDESTGARCVVGWDEINAKGASWAIGDALRSLLDARASKAAQAKATAPAVAAARRAFSFAALRARRLGATY